MVTSASTPGPLGFYCRPRAEDPCDLTFREQGQGWEHGDSGSGAITLLWLLINRGSTLWNFLLGQKQNKTSCCSFLSSSVQQPYQLFPQKQRHPVFQTVGQRLLLRALQGRPRAWALVPRLPVTHIASKDSPLFRADLLYPVTERQNLRAANASMQVLARDKRVDRGIGAVPAGPAQGLPYTSLGLQRPGRALALRLCFCFCS